jgi:hypothetical protein
MDGSFGETGENRRQVFAHRDVHPSAGFDDGEDGGDFGPGLLAADMDPVFATERDRAHGVFGEIVAEFEFRVFYSLTTNGMPRYHVLLLSAKWCIMVTI